MGILSRSFLSFPQFIGLIFLSQWLMPLSATADFLNIHVLFDKRELAKEGEATRGEGVKRFWAGETWVGVLMGGYSSLGFCGQCVFIFVLCLFVFHQSRG